MGMALRNVPDKSINPSLLHQPTLEDIPAGFNFSRPRSVQTLARIVFHRQTAFYGTILGLDWSPDVVETCSEMPHGKMTLPSFFFRETKSCQLMVENGRVYQLSSEILESATETAFERWADWRLDKPLQCFSGNCSTLSKFKVWGQLHIVSTDLWGIVTSRTTSPLRWWWLGTPRKSLQTPSNPLLRF